MFRFCRIRLQFEQHTYFYSFLHWINYIDCTWTDNRVSGGLLLSAFLSIGNDSIQTLRTLDHFAVLQPPTNAKYIFFQGGLRLFLPVCINVKWKIRKFQTHSIFYACPSYLQVWWWSDQKYRRYRIHSISSGAQGHVTSKSMDGYGWNFIWPKIKLVQDFMPFLVKGVIVSTAFSPL